MKDMITGIFMLAVLALLAYFTIVISGIDMFDGKEKVDVPVVFEQVGGLKDHDNVMYRGTKVGTVDRIVLKEREVVVIMNIDKDVILRDTYVIRVEALSMLGGNLLVLEEGTGNKLDLRTTSFVGKTPTDWMRDVQEITADIRRITSSGDVDKTVKNLSEASERINTIANRLEKGEGTVGKLLTDETVYNDLKDTMAGAKTVVNDLKDVKDVVANAKEITEKLKDDKYYNELEAGLTAFRKACEDLDFGGETKENVQQVAAKANEFVTSLNKFMTDMDNGTIGKLAKDDAMYKDIQGLIKDIRQVIDNYRDTTPITTFGSLATGAL